MFRFLSPYRRLIGVVFFLVLLWVAFEVSGLRGHLNLAFVRNQLLGHPVTGLMMFVLFSYQFASRSGDALILWMLKSAPSYSSSWLMRKPMETLST